MSLKQIFEGWKNHLSPADYLKESIKAVSAERLAICRQCPFHRDPFDRSVRPDGRCGDCGCTLSAKTACLSCSCPQDKWGPEITQEQQKIINDETNTESR